jgi:hypothetical protein
MKGFRIKLAASRFDVPPTSHAMTLSLKPMTTTLIGGLVFLLPLIVALAVLGQGLALMAGMARPLAAMFPQQQVGGFALADTGIELRPMVAGRLVEDARALLDACAQPELAQGRGSLLEQLGAMREHECLSALRGEVACDSGERDSLSEACREH